MKIYFKYGVIYREVLTTPRIDICSLNALIKKDRILVNRIVATVVDIIEDSTPGILHECPYNVSPSVHTLKPYPASLLKDFRRT